MAERRMFAKSVVQSSRFLKMPLSAQALYFQLGVSADDDGVVEAWSILKMTGAAEDDLRVLTARHFVQILNEDLVSYLTDWEVNNTIRKDRYHEGIYKSLKLKVLQGWQPNDNQVTTNCQPTVNQVTTEISIGKDSIGKDSINKKNIAQAEREQEAEDMFNALWELYPRKKGKSGVSKTKKLEILKVGYDRMSRAIERFKNDMAGRDMEYVMYGSSFFNKGYLDYLDDDSDRKSVYEEDDGPKRESIEDLFDPWDESRFKEPEVRESV